MYVLPVLIVLIGDIDNVAFGYHSLRLSRLVLGERARRALAAHLIRGQAEDLLSHMNPSSGKPQDSYCACLCGAIPLAFSPTGQIPRVVLRLVVRCHFPEQVGKTPRALDSLMRFLKD